MLYMSVHLDVDVAWLLQCLERFLSGGTYTDDLYETNPPLSFLIYLPAYPLFTTLGLSAKFSILVLFLLYVFLSNAILFKLLHKTQISSTTIIIICCATLTSQTWGAGMFFGLKDHLILSFLTPFILLQYLISTADDKVSHGIAISTSIMGGIALCLKPHYAIIPAVLYAHRLITTKSLKKCLISIDTITLILCGLSYFIFMYIFTPEYLVTMLPENSRLYRVETPFPIGLNLKVFAITIVASFIGFALVISANNEEQQEIKRIVLIFSGLSALCIIPYVIQNKGFLYHTTPLFGFGVAALTMAAYGTCRLLTKKRTSALFLTLVFMAVITHTFTRPMSSSVMNNKQFKAQPIAEYIDENAWNKVYITFDMRSMLSPLPYLLDVKSGSRFGPIGHLYALSILSSRTQNEEEQNKIKQDMMRFVDMMAEDMKKNKPSVIAIPLYPTDQKTNEPSDMYFKFLMANENFAKAMQNYTLDKRIPFNKSLKTGDNNNENIVWHDMYILDKNNNL